MDSETWRQHGCDASVEPTAVEPAAVEPAAATASRTAGLRRPALAFGLGTAALAGLIVPATFAARDDDPPTTSVIVRMNADSTCCLNRRNVANEDPEGLEW